MSSNNNQDKKVLGIGDGSAWGTKDSSARSAAFNDISSKNVSDSTALIKTGNSTLNRHAERRLNTNIYTYTAKKAIKKKGKIVELLQLNDRSSATTTNVTSEVDALGQSLLEEIKKSESSEPRT